MRRIAKHAIRALIVLVLGGFLGATLVRMAPGFGVDEQQLDSRLNADSLLALRRAHTYNGSLAEFYLRYLGDLVHGDFGVSIALHEPVRELVAERLPETLKSVGLGLAVGWTLGLGLAIASTSAQSRYVDMGASLLAILALCVPAAVMALLFLIVQAPARLIIGLVVFPNIFQYTRTILKRTVEMPHILTARAKGLDGPAIMLRHVLPVAGPQILALAGVSVSLAFAATIPVEALCDLPGIGQLAWNAVMSRDLQLLINLTMIVTFVTIVAAAIAELAAVPLRAGEV